MLRLFCVCWAELSSRATISHPNVHGNTGDEENRKETEWNWARRRSGTHPPTRTERENRLYLLLSSAFMGRLRLLSSFPCNPFLMAASLSLSLSLSLTHSDGEIEREFLSFAPFGLTRTGSIQPINSNLSIRLVVGQLCKTTVAGFKLA